MAKLSESVRGQIRFFAFFLANGTLCTDVLEDIDYRDIIEEPSAMEMAFAIFTNVLEVDENGKALNGEEAACRAAQYVRRYFDNSYVVEPPFEPWETELYM